MKSQKIINELNNLFDVAAREQQKHQTTVKNFCKQLMDEKQKLNKNNNKMSRKQLKRKLGKVQEAYDMLNVA